MFVHAGTLILSPTMVAPVCRVGDQLNITCTSSVEFIEWSIMLIYNDLGTPENITELYVGSSGTSQQVPPITVNSTTFTFKRDSPQGASTLISTLSIDSVNIGLNGTIVRCMEVGNLMISASTTIYIVKSDVSNCKLASSHIHAVSHHLSAFIMSYRSIHSNAECYIGRI